MTAAALPASGPRRAGNRLAWLGWNWLLPIGLAYAVAWFAAGLHPKVPPSSAGWDPRGGGAVHLRLKLPGTEVGIPEPVLVYGAPGKAALFYLRLLTGSRAQVGVEYWGVGAPESAVFPLPAPNAVIDVVCGLPEFYPPAGDRSWREIPAEIRTKRLSDYSITVNGVVRLEGPAPYPLPARGECTPAANPVGGSLVTGVFSGKLLAVGQSQ